MMIYPGIGPADQVFSSQAISIQDAMIHSQFMSRGYRDEHSVMWPIIEAIKLHTMVTYDGIATLIDQARYCEEAGIEGAFVDLGTWKGGCLGAMALANLKFGSHRRSLHAFDSFQGIPWPRADKDDMIWACETQQLPHGRCDGSLEAAGALGEARVADVTGLLITQNGYPADCLHIHKGWFQETVGPFARRHDDDRRIAILRLDCDLYDSYTIALDHLWDQVVPGGFVIIDDWCLKGCRDACNEFFARREIKPYLAHVDFTVRWIKK